MIKLPFVLAILFIHWVADFVLQTHEQAVNKSKNVFYLTLHIITYTSALLVLMLVFVLLFHSWFLMGLFSYPPLVVNPTLVGLWVGLNGLSHWITDFYTSKWTSRLWKQQRVHDFFVVIGLDQLIHYFTLFITWYIIV